MDKIATLIAVYCNDTPANFCASVNSIIAQKFSRPIESRIYLAVDGPIPDSLEREINAFGTQIFRVVWIEKNGGLANALNTLIDQLEDEIFIFRMDADDLSKPMRYQAQLDYLVKAPDVDILGTDIEEIDFETGSQHITKFARNCQEARNRLSWRVPVAHPTVCFRRNVLNTVGGYPNIPFNEDIALWFRCAEFGFNFDNVPEPLYQFRIDEAFWKRRNASKAFWEWRCYVTEGTRLNGPSWKLVLPTIRLAMRLSPRWLQKWAYQSKFRRR